MLLLFACSGNNIPNVDSEANKVDTIGVLWERVHHCSRLEVAEYTMLKIVSFDDNSKLNLAGVKIPLPGERKLMIPIEVKMKAIVDLTFVTRNDISVDSSTINITLPSPRIEIYSTKIDHERERESVSFFRSNFTENEREIFMKQGIEDVKNSIPATGFNEIAKRNTEKLLKPTILNSGFKQHVNLTFKEEEISISNFKD